MQRFLIGFLLVALATGDASAAPAPIVGAPDFVYDGDTVFFGKVRVRIFGVDAPEMSTPIGPPARRHLVALIGHGPLRCFDTGTSSYGRIVAKCYLPNGEDLAGRMVRDGWAVDWPSFSGGAYAALQVRAQAERAGAFAQGVRPWR